MAGGDWVKLHRKILDHPVFARDGLFRLWTYCLCKANWRATRWLIPGTLTEIEIPRGAFITGRNSLHAALYSGRDEREVGTPSASTLWRWLVALETMKCVELKNVDNRCTIVSICNYSIYQDIKNEKRTTDAQPMHNRCTSDGHRGRIPRM